MIRRLLPRSLAGRTALFLTLALMLVQAAGLTIHALDRVDLQRLGMSREISARAFGIWRTMLLAPPDRRESMLFDIEMPDGLAADLSDSPAVRPGMSRAPLSMVRLFQLDLIASSPPRFRPREALVASGPHPGLLVVAMRLPDGPWLNLWLTVPPPRPWHSETFLVAFMLMTGAALALILWATRRLVRPVSALSRAAERLGRDVNAPPLPESGPSEVVTAARAFNTMAERIRRFVGDRTQMLAAIGHDLRTPITRLRLRAEFMDDDEQRRKMLSDLDEMEAMVNATLAFARDDSATEPSVAVDLAALCRTVLDEAADARPDLPQDAIAYEGPDRQRIRGRPIALKRALANLVANALNYAGNARVVLQAPVHGVLTLKVEDDGDGIPEESLEAVFQPFRRLEASRNRETGGTGLGLPIARNILRAHGGDVVLRNRPEGGLRAVATLPE
ncbi:ATP-binding protein [Roseomonas haemaphysalidis]|uniref:histidine kinase n=1 Tax=Roseomonas haemaphysalidis TaxID=2768162 RepID=A0ABS3KSC9_9PROT|nr:ATP-binding protein [Roseomonas haemaphysalidis]MBO1080351.1 HAMP domain-containing protein [Roseomonas haemaphysalidis]